MPDQTVPPPPAVPPVITATTRLAGITGVDVTQLEHEQVNVTFLGTGGHVAIEGPLAELRVMLANADRQIDLLRRSGPGH